MATLAQNVFTAHTPITVGLLRNGVAADVARTARESSIAAKHYFTGVRYSAAIRGNTVRRIPDCPTVLVFEAQWRSAFSTIVSASVNDARAAHVAAAAGAGAGAAFDETAARAAAAASATNRVEAIALGGVHTALVMSYQIAETDLNATESGAATLTLTAPVAAADADAYTALMRDPLHGWTVTLASTHATAATTAAEDVMLNAAPLNAVEVELAFGMISLGQVAPVRAGAQLFTDGHHYHSDAEGTARHKAIEKEVTGRLSAAARNMWRAHLDRLRNCVWHAGIHSVLADILQGFAEDDAIPARLDATGYGSMSVGLPAQEDLFQRAGSYQAVYNQVLQTATAHQHSVSITKMIATVTALSGLPRRGPLAAQRPALPDNPSAAWPAGCNTRAKALKLFLEPALDIAEPVVAWMFGFFREICSRNGIRANTQEGSLLRSYSLKRAVANYLGEANRAQEMYSARARYIRAQGEKGALEAYTGSA